MSVYWLSFRLKDNPTYEQRYDKLHKSIEAMASKWWLETSSFYVFECAKDIDGVTAAVKAAVTPSTDIVLIGMTDFKTARVIGASQDDDIFELMPLAKKA